MAKHQHLHRNDKEWADENLAFQADEERSVVDSVICGENQGLSPISLRDIDDSHADFDFSAELGQDIGFGL